MGERGFESGILDLLRTVPPGAADSKRMGSSIDRAQCMS